MALGADELGIADDDRRQLMPEPGLEQRLTAMVNASSTSTA